MGKGEGERSEDRKEGHRRDGESQGNDSICRLLVKGGTV